MSTKSEARELVMTLAMQGKCAGEIVSELGMNGHGGVLTGAEIDSMVTEAQMAAALIPKRASRAWPRIVGIIAILMGVGAIALGVMPGVHHRYQPAGWGLGAIVLGLVLVIKPDWAGERIK